MAHALFTDETGRVRLVHHKPDDPRKLPPARRAKAALIVDELPDPPQPSAPNKRPVMFVRDGKIEWGEEDRPLTEAERLDLIEQQLAEHGALLQQIAAKLDR